MEKITQCEALHNIVNATKSSLRWWDI